MFESFTAAFAWSPLFAATGVVVIGTVVSVAWFLSAEKDSFSF